MDEIRKDSSSSVEKMEEVMLPGFRFHPTDEELVGFYLKRKIQHRPLSIELIKQLDIYKYDPWDLPKMATTGEKEWYFFCPRDRKYRNSARPNRVTGAGFWKATGTDRPIYSSESSKCIGLKKSLVFYKGRAAKGIKTDWMMHEFRLPSTMSNGNNNIESSSASSTAAANKRYMDKHIPIPANDAWAICRIFKKANSTAQRALSHSWVSPIMLHETSHHLHHDDDDMQTEHFHGTTTTKGVAAAAASSSVIQFGDSSSSEVIQQQSSSSIASFSPILLDPTNFHYNNNTKCSSISPMMMMMMSGTGSDHDHDQLSHSHHRHEVSTSKCHDHDLQLLNTMICPIFPTTTTNDTTTTTTATNIDASSLLLNMSSSVFGDMGKSYACGVGSTTPTTTTSNVSISQEQCSNFLMAAVVPDQDIRRNYFAAAQQDHHHQKTAVHHYAAQIKEKEQWDSMQSLVGIPVMNMGDDAWKSNLLWDTSPCPSDISTTYSTNKCCT